MAVVVAVAAPPSMADVDRPLPEGVSVEIVGRGSSQAEAWASILVSLLDSTTIAIGAGWDQARGLGRALVGEDAVWVHLASRNPGDWLHGVRWRDPESIAAHLRDLDARPLGGGRFELDSGRVRATLMEDWVVLQPSATGWRPPIRGMLRAVGREIDARSDPVVLEARLEHQAPVDGVTRLRIQPTGKRTAEVKVLGRYESSPFGASPVAPVEARTLAAMEDRFAAVLLESGVGLLDPRLVEASIDIPELIPPQEVRRHLGTGRLLVLDSIRSDGGIETPVLGMAVPLRELPPPDTDFVGLVDAWLEHVAETLWTRWNPGPAPERTVAPASGINHRPLGPGFLAAMDRHPLAFATTINWTVILSDREDRPGWLVLGTAPSVVEALSTSLRSAPDDHGAEPLAMAGSSRPPRLAQQVRSLAGVRRLGGDPESDADSALLQRLADALDTLARVAWTVPVRTPTDLELTVRVERLPDGTSMEEAP